MQKKLCMTRNDRRYYYMIIFSSLQYDIAVQKVPYTYIYIYIYERRTHIQIYIYREIGIDMQIDMNRYAER